LEENKYQTRILSPGFVNYKKGCTRLATASDKVYQLLAHGWWFSPASSTTKTGRRFILKLISISHSISKIIFVCNQVMYNTFGCP
jgi:hypothetical protein